MMPKKTPGKDLADLKRARVFILSPASCGGRRAEILLNEKATFDMACRVRSQQGAPLGEVFSFLSGLYFRGKLAYALRFARATVGLPGVLVITPNRGLLPATAPVSLADLRSFAEVPIDERDVRYCEPLRRDVNELSSRLGAPAEVVLLGSIATSKYGNILLEAFAERLLFPIEFVGRGDMSRGGLMLRHVDEGRELTYVPLAGAVRRGSRPARLPKRS